MLFHAYIVLLQTHYVNGAKVRVVTPRRSLRRAPVNCRERRNRDK